MVNHDQVASISGDPYNTQTVLLLTGSPIPPANGFLVVNASETDTTAVLGRVTDITANVDGTTTVETTPATLDEAYDRFAINYSDSTPTPWDDIVPDDSAAPEQPNVPGFESTTPAPTTSSGPTAFWENRPRLPAGDRRSAVSAAPIKQSAFECTGTSGVALSIDEIRWGELQRRVSLDIGDPHRANVQVTASIEPIVVASISTTGGFSCKIKSDIFKKFVIAIPGTPLTLQASPILTLAAEGADELTLTTTLAFTDVGVKAVDGRWNPSGDYSAKGTVEFDVTSSTTAGVGIEIAPAVAGRIGISIDTSVGTELKTDGTCLTASAMLSVQASYFADIFVKRWTASIAPKLTASAPFWTNCLPTTSTSPPVSTTTATPPTTTTDPPTTAPEPPYDQITCTDVTASDGSTHPQLNWLAEELKIYPIRITRYGSVVGQTDETKPIPEDFLPGGSEIIYGLPNLLGSPDPTAYPTVPARVSITKFNPATGERNDVATIDLTVRSDTETRCAE